MKKIILILASLLSLSFAHNNFSIPLQPQQTSTQKQDTDQTQQQKQASTSWFSRITSSVSSFFSTLISPFTIIKEYFFPSKTNSIEATPPAAASIAPQEPTSVEAEKESPPSASQDQATLPLVIVDDRQQKEIEEEKIEEERKKEEENEKLYDQLMAQHVKDQIKSIHPSTNIYSIAYSCKEDRLQLTFPKPNFVRMFYVDFYEATPKKNYFFATKFTTSMMQSVGGSTRQQAYRSLINPIELNQKNSKAQDAPQFENVKMYDFSPNEKRIILLTSDASVWSAAGIVKPKTEHDNPTGEINKPGGGIFAYHIYDIASKKEITNIQNALSVSFINDDQIAVYFNDNTSEIQDLGASWFSIFSGSKSPDQEQPQYQPLIKYYPHLSKLEFTQSNITTEHAIAYHFSPKKNYVIVEKPRDWAKYLYDMANSINQERPLMHLFDVKTGEEKTNFVQFNLLQENTTNIISYTFNEDETQMLLFVKDHCKFVLFDITKNQIIEQPIQNAQSVYFNEEDKSILTAIDLGKNKHTIPIKEQNESFIFDKAARAITGKTTSEIIKSAQSYKSAAYNYIKSLTKPTQSIEQRNKETEEFFEDFDEDSEEASQEISQKEQNPLNKEMNEFFEEEKFEQEISEKAEELLTLIKKDCQNMQEADVNSAGIMNSLWNKVVELEDIIPSCETSQRQEINEELLKIKDEYFPAWKKVISNLVASGWNTHKKTINEVMSYLIVPALTAAIMPALQISTGNASLSTTAFFIPAMTSIAATGLNKLAQKKQISSDVTVPAIGGFASIAREIAPLYNKTAAFPALPSKRGVISGILFATAAASAHKTFVKEIENAPTLLQQYSKEIIVRDAAEKSNNELVNMLLPYTEKVVSDPQIQKYLAQVTYVAGQSIAIGIACYFAGIGYYDETSLAQAIYYAGLRGLTSGALAYIATDVTQKTGAIIAAPIDTLATSFVNTIAKTNGVTLSPAIATTVALQVAAKTAIDLLAEKTNKKPNNQQNIQKDDIAQNNTPTNAEENAQDKAPEEPSGFISLIKESGGEILTETTRSLWEFVSTMGSYIFNVEGAEDV
jgi:hypothetical protein